MNPLSQAAKSLVRAIGESSAKPFYSPIDKAISEIVQTKGTGEQMLAQILKTKGVAKELKERPAIKAALQQPKITKAELEKVAAENPPPSITEKVEKGPSEIKYKVEHDDLNDRYDVVDDYSNVVKSFRDYDDAESYATKLTGGTTRHEKWQLPGGKNYREIKLMLPLSENPKEIASRAVDKAQAAYTMDNSYENYTKLLDARAKADAINANWTPTEYKSSHFPEPNILAHARVSDRTGPNGEKILHVEEIQSDWHQAGRKKGYQLPPEERQALDKRRAEIESYGINATPEQKQEWADVMNKLQPETQHLKVPDAHFKQNWHELVMKRLLDDAAKKGYDKVVITPGAEQAKRYDLSKHFGEISYKHNEDGTVSIIGTDKKSGLANLHEEDIPKEKIEDYVGKELAEKIMNNVGTPYEGNSRMRQGSMTLSNLDLKVGGEGMKGFYDQMLPAFLNDYGKKWGARVKPDVIFTNPDYEIVKANAAKMYGEGSEPYNQAIENMTKQVHSFTITPQMREDIVGKGQPLYQAIPAGVGAGTLAAPQEEVPEQPMKKGGAVGMDAMRMAVMNKQLRKHHG